MKFRSRASIKGIMRIIGIDPGINKTGYGVIDYTSQKLFLIEYGCISPESYMEFHKKLLSICTQIEDVLKKYKPEIAVVEDIFYAVNVRSALKLGHIRGALITTIANHQIELIELTPLEIKKSITGYGRAEKGQVAEMVRIVLGLQETPVPADSSDALAAAIAYALRSDFEQILLKQNNKRE